MEVERHPISYKKVSNQTGLFICTNKTITLLDDTYQGILLYIDLEQFTNKTINATE